MKSERRHELQHNELADWLFKTGERIKPYQNMIMAGVVIVAVAIMVSWWWARTTTTRTGQAWTELGTALNAGSPDLLGVVADEYPNMVVGDTAAAMLGDIRLAEGCNQRFATLTIAQKDLKNAAESYSKILEGNGPEALRQRATYGMARVKETQGDLESATRLYKEIVTNWPHGPYTPASKQRLEDFQQPETKRMFGDLRKFEPKGEFSEEPGVFNSPSNLGMPEEPPVRRAADDLGKAPVGESKKPSASPVGKSKTDADKKNVDKKSDGKKNTNAESKKP